MVVTFFYLIFLFVIVYVRLDFSISRDEAAESKLKVASYIENVQSVLDRRSALYQAYDDAVNKYKVSVELLVLSIRSVFKYKMAVHIYSTISESTISRIYVVFNDKSWYWGTEVLLVTNVCACKDIML